MTTHQLVDRLREYAEWADANEYEVPLCLGDDLREAADYIEQKERAEKDSEKSKSMCKGLS